MMYLLDSNNIPYPTYNNVKNYGILLNKQKIVKQDYIGEVFISTVFLGIDHSRNGETPLLFETMIFGGKHDEFQTRYTSYKEAEDMHLKIVNAIKEEKEDPDEDPVLNINNNFLSSNKNVQR